MQAPETRYGISVSSFTCTGLANGFRTNSCTLAAPAAVVSIPIATILSNTRYTLPFDNVATQFYAQPATVSSATYMTVGMGGIMGGSSTLNATTNCYEAGASSFSRFDNFKSAQKLTRNPEGNGNIRRIEVSSDLLSCAADKTARVTYMSPVGYTSGDIVIYGQLSSAEVATELHRQTVLWAQDGGTHHAEVKVETFKVGMVLTAIIMDKCGMPIETEAKTMADPCDYPWLAVFITTYGVGAVVSALLLLLLVLWILRKCANVEFEVGDVLPIARKPPV